MMAEGILPDGLVDLVKDTAFCREAQISQLYLLLGSKAWAPQTIVLHGVTATGKSSIIGSVLSHLDTLSATIRCRECVTTRHLLERTISSIREALVAQFDPDILPVTDGRCENIANFVAELQKLLLGRTRFILVFDNIDQQREPAPTLLPALTRLGESIPNLTTVLISTRSNFQAHRNSSILYVHFPPYSKDDILSIIAHSSFALGSLGPNSRTSTGQPPQWTYSEEDTHWLWTRYVSHVWDSQGQNAARDLVSFRRVCEKLWKPFIQPVIDGQYGVRGSQELSKLLVRNRPLLQSESVLTASLVRADPAAVAASTTTTPVVRPREEETWSLPPIPTYLLLASFLASTTHPKHDIQLFSHHAGSTHRRRRRTAGHPSTNTTPHKSSATGSGAPARKIPRRLQGPHAFPFERMLAIFHALTDGEVKGGAGAEVLGQFATLVSLRLVVGGSGGSWQDVLGEGGGKWKCMVGEEMCRRFGRTIGVDLGEYLLD